MAAQQSKSKPAADMAKRHRTVGKLLVLYLQAEWRSLHNGINIASKLIFYTASPSGLGQQGH
jgi:hypothetical protein